MTAPKPKQTSKTPKGVSAIDDGLSVKQRAFVAEYLLSGNATQAAIAAGYSAKTARQIGAQNLTKVNVASYLAEKQSIIAARQDERLEAMELTEARVAREVARLAFFDPRKMFAADGRPLNLTELDSDTAACIVGIDVLEEYAGSGEDRVLVGHVKKYKIADKNAALDKAAKILGMFKKDNEQPGAATANAIQSLLATMGRSAFPVAK